MTKGTEILPLERSPARTSLSSPRMGLQPGRRLISTSVGCKDNGNDGTYANMDLRSHVRGCARIVAQRLRADRSRRRRRRCPGNVVEVEKVQQVGLRGIAGGQVRVSSDEAVLNKLDDRRVVHGNVRDIVPPGERRDHDVRQRGSQAAPRSRAPPPHRRGARRDHPVADRSGRSPFRRLARMGCSCPDSRQWSKYPESAPCDASVLFVGVARHRRNVIVGTAALVVAEEED